MPKTVEAQGPVDVTVRPEPVAWICEFYISPEYEHQEGFWTEKIISSKLNVGACKADKRSYRNWQPLYAIPEGWALVPIEPTPEMMDAHDSLLMRGVPRGRNLIYAAMLEAAPKPPNAGGNQPPRTGGTEA